MTVNTIASKGLKLQINAQKIAVPTRILTNLGAFYRDLTKNDNFFDQ